MLVNFVLSNDHLLGSTSANISEIPAGSTYALGGGSGSTYGALPPGTRMVFKLTGGGFSDIPVEKAVSALVSATPSWQHPAS